MFSLLLLSGFVFRLRFTRPATCILEVSRRSLLLRRWKWRHQRPAEASDRWKVELVLKRTMSPCLQGCQKSNLESGEGIFGHGQILH